MSYILLGGKCRHCRKKISARYPFIEALTGIIGGLLALLFTWIAYRTIDGRFIKLVFFDPRFIVVGILTGALIGVAGSATSVWSHLRRI